MAVEREHATTDFTIVMVTVFHVLPLIGACCGLVLGAVGGQSLGGVAGGMVGALVGCLSGLALGRLPLILVARSLNRDLAGKSTAGLRAELRNPAALTPNAVLLELRRRGEDIRPDLPVVLDMLVAEDFGRRARGWAALSSAFPEWAARLADYRGDSPVSDCRRKTERLRAEAGALIADQLSGHPRCDRSSRR
jgi:hypothetical protein